MCRVREGEHSSPSGCQCHSSGGAMWSWNAQYPGWESIELGQSIKKSSQQQSPCVLSGSQEPHWSTRVQWQSAHSVVELKWRWVSNAPMSNVHCAPSHSGTSQKQENKNHIPPCLNEWGTGRWFPDISDPLTLSLQADHSINLIFIWCNISRIPSCLYYSEDCISSSNHIIALGMCVQLDIHHKHCLLHSHHLWEKAFPFFAFPFCSERIWS